MHRIAAIVAVLLAAGALLYFLVRADGPDRAAAPSGPRASQEETTPTPGELPGDAETTVPAAALSGDVLAATGEPGRGARIRVVPLGADGWAKEGGPVLTALADARGSFAVPDVPPGLYRVEARTENALGCVPVLRLREGLSSRVRIRLEPYAEIAGFVISEEGHPLAGATVSADLGGVNRALQAALGVPGLPLADVLAVRTDDSGAFRLPRLPRGQYELAIEAPRHLPARIPAVNAPADGIEIRLVRTFKIDGRVFRRGRGPVGRVRIVARPSDAEVMVETEKSEADFALGGLTRGRHRILAFAEDGATAEAEVAIEAGRRPEVVELNLSRDGVLWGRVRGATVIPEGTTLVFYRADRRDRYGQRIEEHLAVPVRPDGEYAAPIPEGYWVARLRVPGRGELRAEAIFRRELFRRRGSQGERRDFEFGAMGTIRGRVVYEDGWPAGDVRVRYRNAAARTDTGGHFALEGLALFGSHEVRASDGWNEASRTVRLARDQTGEEVTLRLPRGGTGTVRGQVISEENEPVAGVTVLFLDGYAVTDADGRFSRSDVRPGPNRLRFFAPGYSTGLSRPFTVRPGEVVTPALLVLPWRAARVTGRVLDGRGDPIPGAIVTVRFPDLDREFVTAADATGHFLQEGPGAIEQKATITVAAPGYRSETRSLRVVPEVEEAEFRLARTPADR